MKSIAKKLSGNLLNQVPKQAQEEIFETLIQNESLMLERIISHGQITPENHWYDQEWNEWVVLLTGRAKLRFENNQLIELSPGDFLNIPARKRHRIDWTAPNEETIWLALHYK